MNFIKNRRNAAIAGSTLLLLVFGYFLGPRAVAVYRGGWAVLSVPRIRCDEPAFDFGDAATGDTVSTTFLIHNDGYKPLEIVEVRPECGCTQVSMPATIIPPSKSIALSATLSLTNLRGQQQQHIRVSCNDPTTPHLILSFRGTATSEVELKPPILNFNTVVEDGQATQAIDIVTAKPLELSKIVPSNPELISVRAEPLEGQNGRRLHVTLKPTKRGRIYESLRIGTDNAKEPEIVIPVYALVAGELAVQPDAIYVNGASGTPVTFWVNVGPGKVQEFRIKSIEAPAPGIQVETFPAPDKRGYNIKLSNLFASNELHGKKLKILTDAKGMEEILVPFHVVGQPVASR